MQPGTALWFARHESRLAWRDWVAMMTAGRRARRYRVAGGLLVFFIVLHVIAYFVIGGFAAATPDKPMLIAITATLLLSWLLMVSQATESMTRAFYTRSDLDLILASPVAAREVFAVRISMVALSVAAMALPLAAPFINVLIALGGWHWLGAYSAIVAMSAAATAVAVALTVALFRGVGPKRTRLVAQVVAAVIGAAFVIGMQVAAILSYGTLSRSDLLQSAAVQAISPDAGSVLWWPAWAVLGDGAALAGVLAFGLLLLVLTVAIVSPRFGEYAMAAASVGNAQAGRVGRSRSFHVTSPCRALRRKEWMLLRRDPWLASQTLMQFSTFCRLRCCCGEASKPAAARSICSFRCWSCRQASSPAASPGSRSRARMRPISSPRRRCLRALSCAQRSRRCSRSSPPFSCRSSS